MKEIIQKLNQQFQLMQDTGYLFVSNVPGEELWDIYISSFKNDPIFRDPNSSKNNCDTCRHFIERYGGIVALNSELELMTLFDFEIEGEFNLPVTNLRNRLHNSTIAEVFKENKDVIRNNTLGIEKNTKVYTKEDIEKHESSFKVGDFKTFYHLHLKGLKERYITELSQSKIQYTYRELRMLFKRALKEISLESLKLAQEFIIQGSLLNGKTHLHKVNAMISYKEEYLTIPNSKKENWLWIKAYDNPHCRFKNELIGVLCSELDDNIEKACINWNKRVDPINYMKAKAPISQAQIKAAQSFVEENGYVESFNRRLATLEDIKVSDIKHINSSSKSISIFDTIIPTKTSTPNLSNIPEVSIDTFMEEIMPGSKTLELYLENRLEGNMVSLTTSKEKDSKPIFKWSNNYSWTYNGNLEGKSQIKESVRKKGGKVDGVLRFSIMWAENEKDNSDLDAWCVLPNQRKIYYNQKQDNSTKGELDIDIINPQEYDDVVENITFPSKDRLLKGNYHFKVHNYNNKNSQGFKAEIEFEGNIYSYSYDKPLGQDQVVKVATVSFMNDVFNIEHHLEEKCASKPIYNLQSNQFHQVNLVCLSPNYWDDNVGNKHYFFMLEECESPYSVRGFHNTNLIPSLLEHRKVLEVLGTKTMIKSTPNQLSGVGFNATVKDHVILKVDNKIFKVNV